MKIYVGIYNGLSSKDILTRSPIHLGGSPTVYLIDLMYDDESLEIKEKLERAGIRCIIKPGEGSGMSDVGNLVTRTCIESQIEARRENYDARVDAYLEIGNLDNVLSGAMFLSAIRSGGRVVYYHDDELEELENIRPLPDVSRRSFIARQILDTLYQEDGQNYERLARSVYADEIAGLDESEIKEFFKKRHNTYKVLQGLREDGWIEYNSMDKTYRITPEGNTARVMFEVRDLDIERRSKLKRKSESRDDYDY